MDVGVFLTHGLVSCDIVKTVIICPVIIRNLYNVEYLEKNHNDFS